MASFGARAEGDHGEGESLGDEVARRQARRDQSQPFLPRLYHRRREGCGHGLWRAGTGTTRVSLSSRRTARALFPGALDPRRIRLSQSARVSRHHPRGRASGPRGHHADVRLRQRTAHHQRRPLPQFPRHAGRAQPFRTATIDQIQCGKIECDRTAADFPGANLGLYSVTFVNDLDQDRETLAAFKEFREEAERKQFRYFLEVFDPNVQSGIAPEKLGEFINDNIIRSLAGVPESGRPVFLKIVYHGPRAMEELAQYDPNLVVGVLGGSAGTTYDAFRLIHDAQKYGARVALFGRKINNAEHQLAFIEMLRLITDGKVTPEEAVRAYHGVLQSKGIKPHRSLDDDLKLTDQVMSYDSSSSRRTTVEVRNNPLANTKPAGVERKSGSLLTSSASGDWPKRADGSPDFDSMSPAQRHAYHQARLDRTLR